HGLAEGSRNPSGPWPLASSARAHGPAPWGVKQMQKMFLAAFSIALLAEAPVLALADTPAEHAADNAEASANAAKKEAHQAKKAAHRARHHTKKAISASAKAEKSAI